MVYRIQWLVSNACLFSVLLYSFHPTDNLQTPKIVATWAASTISSKNSIIFFFVINIDHSKLFWMNIKKKLTFFLYFLIIRLPNLSWNECGMANIILSRYALKSRSNGCRTIRNEVESFNAFSNWKWNEMVFKCECNLNSIDWNEPERLKRVHNVYALIPTEQCYFCVKNPVSIPPEY